MLPSHAAACSIALLFFGVQAHGQSSVGTSAAPEVVHSDLPPSTVYAETLAPFERTRSDLANWSDIEHAAFRTTTDTAKTECLRLEQNPHEAEEALALARLCSVGMDWQGTYSAARWYTRKTAPAGEASHLALGFGLLLQADLNLQATPRAIDDLREMQGRMPLSADTDSIFTYTVAALEIMQPERGLEAAMMRQAPLLEVIAGTSSAEPALSQGVAEEEAWHTLSLLHLAHRTKDETQAKSQLLQAVSQRTTVPSTTDLYLAQRARKRYEWLEQPAPEIHVTRNTYPVSRQAPVPVRTELIVFEQEDAPDVPALAFGIDALRRRLPKGTQATMVLLATHAAADTAQQRATPAHALYTNDNLTETFAFSNGPLFVIEDVHHRVKYLGTGTLAWLNPQMQAERLIDSNLGAIAP